MSNYLNKLVLLILCLSSFAIFYINIKKSYDYYNFPVLKCLLVNKEYFKDNKYINNDYNTYYLYFYYDLPNSTNKNTLDLIKKTEVIEGVTNFNIVYKQYIINKTTLNCFKHNNNKLYEYLIADTVPLILIALVYLIFGIYVFLFYYL